MMTYVDTSTLLKLIIDEEGSDRAALIWQTSDSVASVGLVAVEARAALAAAGRHGRLTSSQHRAAKKKLAAVVGDLFLVDVGAELIVQASDLAETEALRGYDAVHLAAALRISASVFTSSDSALCDAAARQGMNVANPLIV